MPDGRLLDPASDDYRIVAALIRSAHQEAGAARSQWWNGDIAVLPTTSRARSRSDLDGTIHLHPRHVIAPLHRAAGGGRDRWWNPKATRDASYNVIYEGLRLAGPTGLDPSTPNQPLDRALPYNLRSLDRALNEQLTYEIAENVMTANGLGDSYEADPFETKLGGHGLSADLMTRSVFRINDVSTAPTAAARGLVDGLAEAADRPRQRVFSAMVQSLKTDRFGLGLSVVAESQQPGVLAELEARGLLVDATEVRREAGREWAKVTGMRIHTISTISAAEERGYTIGRDTAAVLARAGSGLAAVGSRASELQVAVEPPAQVATRELSPNDILGPQVSPGGKPTSAGTTPAQRSGTERPDHQVDR